MTHYRYRIQVGDQYTYRESLLELDRLVQDLLDEGLGEGRDAKLARLIRKAKGSSSPEPPPAKKVAAEDILITVETTRAPQQQKWHTEKGKKE